MYRSFFEALSFRKSQRKASADRTEHFYVLHAPKMDSPPTEEVGQKLEKLGYEPVWDTAFGLTLRDTRVRASYGQVTFGAVQNLPHGDLVEVSTADNGPEFYDEMAGYVFVILAEQVDSLVVRQPSRPNVAASDWAKQLPDSPYGLAGIASLR